MGKLNTRVLDGPMRLPKHREDQLKVIADMYDAWFRTDRDLLKGNLVYFV